MRTRKISISDFEFKMSGYGHYTVSYTSPATGKSWIATINDMSLIDATKNADDPKDCDLKKLKKVIKGG